MATPTTLGPVQTDGKCGWQHGRAQCLPSSGRSCCSEDGYCGGNETYCGGGCQYGDCVSPDQCVSVYGHECAPFSSTLFTLPISSPTDPAASSATGSSGFLTSTLLSDSSTTQTSLPPSVTEVSHHISGTARKGAIAGGVIGGLFVLCILIWICSKFWSRRNRPAYIVPASTSSMETTQRPRTPPEWDQAPHVSTHGRVVNAGE